MHRADSRGDHLDPDRRSPVEPHPAPHCAARELSEGHLDTRVTPPGNSREMGELTLAFNSMAERVQARSSSSAATATAAARLPGRRVARAAHAHRGAAHIQRAAERWRGRGRGDTARVPRADTPADRAPRLAGRQPARAVQARLRASCCSTCDPTTCGPSSRAPWRRRSRAPQRKGVRLVAELPD